MVEQTVEHRGDRRGVAEQACPVLDRAFDVMRLEALS